MVHPPRSIETVPVMRWLRDELLKLLPWLRVSGAVVNYYPNGSSHIPFHQDSEKTIAKDSLILSGSWGETRPMEFQHACRSYGSEAVDDSVLLTPGTLLIMSAASQQHWRHRVPSDRSIKGPRVNVTFRLMTSATFSSPSPITVQSPTCSLASAAVDSNCTVEPGVGVSGVVNPATLLAKGLCDDNVVVEDDVVEDVVVKVVAVEHVVVEDVVVPDVVVDYVVVDDVLVEHVLVKDVVADDVVVGDVVDDDVVVGGVVVEQLVADDVAVEHAVVKDVVAGVG